MTEATKLSVTLAAAIVVYRSDSQWLETTLASLAAALKYAHTQNALASATVVLVDNAAATHHSSCADVLYRHFPPGCEWLTASVLAGHGNIGYGAAHNMAFATIGEADYLLALNPDVDIDMAAIANALTCFADTPDCGMITPVATDARGEPLYLVKDYPAVSTLAIRGYAPAFVRGLFRQRLIKYDRADRAFDSVLEDARIVSGCFMLMRRRVFAAASGFDSAYFLYFEDFDLSFRISVRARIVRLPSCRIVHGGGHAAKKGLNHAWMFMRSARRFFSRHGWRW